MKAVIAGHGQDRTEIISFSNPPPPLVRGRPVTFADVMMMVVKDGPLYAMFMLVGLLVLKGHADAIQGILGAAVGLLAHSTPSWRDKMKSIASGVIIIVGLSALQA